MKRILASILAAILLLVILLQFDTETFPEGSIFLDDVETAQNIDQQQLYDELFAPDSVIKIDVNISRRELENLQKDYDYYELRSSKSPIYRLADSVTFDINGKKYVIKEVGVRMKGSTTRISFYKDLIGVYNLINLRLSFNETFDDLDYYSIDGKRWKSDKEREQRLERTFATLQNLELRWNSSLDNTYTRAIYASEMFRDNGILAQKGNLSTLNFGNWDMGVYSFYEPVDEIFINRYLPKEDQGGDLYKCKWTIDNPVNYTWNNTYGVANKNKGVFYNFELKTNKDTSQHKALKNLFSVINSENITKSSIEKVIDSDYFLRFCAINYLIGNQDDMRNNYNNHYVYFRPSDGKAIFIPYDCERSFGCRYRWDPSECGMTKISPYSSQAVSVGKAQTNPLIINTVTYDGFYKDEYTEYLKEISNGKWLTEENYLKYYNVFKDNYSHSIVECQNFINTNHHNMEFTMEGNIKNNENLTIKEFMEGIKATTKKYTEQVN